MRMCSDLKPEPLVLLPPVEPEPPLLNLFCNNSPPSRNGIETCSSSLGSQGSSSLYRVGTQRILTPSPELDQSSSDNMLPSNTSGSGGSSSPVDSPIMTSTRYPSPEVVEQQEKPVVTNGSGTHKYRNNSESNGSSHKTARYVMKGYIAALKDGFGFIETVAQDGEIFFHSRWFKYWTTLVVFILNDRAECKWRIDCIERNCSMFDIIEWLETLQIENIFLGGLVPNLICEWVSVIKWETVPFPSPSRGLEHVEDSFFTTEIF